MRNRAFLMAAALLLAIPAAPARAGECADALITAGVKMRLLADDVVGVFKINVETDECIVTLHGCVGSKAQVKRAKNLAGRVKGVKGVKSRLAICPAPDDAPDDKD